MGSESALRVFARNVGEDTSEPSAELPLDDEDEDDSDDNDDVDDDSVLRPTTLEWP
jgi:hypothetical protein